MDKQEFLKVVEDYTRYDESVLGDLLNIVTKKYNQMVEREKNRRDSAHYKVARDLLDQVWHDNIFGPQEPEHFSSTTCCNLLDAMSEIYPNCRGGSVASEQLLHHFYKSVKKYNWKPNDSFVKQIRGKNEWLTKLYERFDDVEDS